MKVIVPWITSQASSLPSLKINTYYCAYWTESKHKKIQTSRFMWFPKSSTSTKTSYCILLKKIIQTLNLTLIQSQKPSVSLLHLVFFSNMLFLSLSTHCIFFLHSIHSLPLSYLHTSIAFPLVSFYSWIIGGNFPIFSLESREKIKPQIKE